MTRNSYFTSWPVGVSSTLNGSDKLEKLDGRTHEVSRLTIRPLASRPNKLSSTCAGVVVFVSIRPAARVMVGVALERPPDHEDW
jgi:hypothetical protein